MRRTGTGSTSIPGKVVGSRIPDLLSPGGVAACKPVVVDGATARFDLAWPWPDGRRRIAKIRCVPRFSPDGAADGFYVLVQDVTAQRDAGALLATEKATLAREVVERTAARDRLRETTNGLMGRRASTPSRSPSTPRGPPRWAGSKRRS